MQYKCVLYHPVRSGHLSNLDTFAKVPFCVCIDHFQVSTSWQRWPSYMVTIEPVYSGHPSSRVLPGVLCGACATACCPEGLAKV